MLERWVHKIVSISGWIAAGCLVVMMTYTVADVIGRSVFNRPLPVSVQLSENLVVVVAFLLIAYTQLRRGHISIELVVSRLSERQRTIQQLVVLVLSLLIIIVIAWRTSLTGYEAWQIKDWVPTSGVRFPVWPAKLFVSVGLFLLCLQLIADIHGVLRKIIASKSES